MGQRFEENTTTVAAVPGPSAIPCRRPSVPSSSSTAARRAPIGRARRRPRRRHDERAHPTGTRANRSGNCATSPSWSVSATTRISVKMSSNALTSASQSCWSRATASPFVSCRWSASRSTTSSSGQFGFALDRKRAISPDVRRPAGVVRREGGVVAGLRGLDEVDRDQDVLLEELGQAVAGSLAVVRHDRRADVLLVPEQPARGRSGIGRPGDRRDDVLAGPDHVVRPELPQRQPDRFRCRHGERLRVPWFYG